MRDFKFRRLTHRIVKPYYVKHVHKFGVFFTPHVHFSSLKTKIGTSKRKNKKQNEEERELVISPQK